LFRAKFDRSCVYLLSAHTAPTAATHPEFSTLLPQFAHLPFCLGRFRSACGVLRVVMRWAMANHTTAMASESTLLRRLTTRELPTPLTCATWCLPVIFFDAHSHHARWQSEVTGLRRNANPFLRTRVRVCEFGLGWGARRQGDEMVPFVTRITFASRGPFWCLFQGQ